ncbi:hypothetical protein [Shewanella baltica]|uniref:hypothetical protein n=2 Tax=Shewanella baltica TaxID=62322 RepID=UPI00217D8F2E|nr:hypothetical protein [Shewanella baltica]
MGNTESGMRAWRIYFWFCVLQLIMNYRAAMMSTVAWYDVINWLVMLQGLIGLQGQVYKLRFFSQKVWQRFFPIFCVWSLMYVGINWASNTTNPPDISSNIGYVIILMLTIPQCLALYQYAVNWHHLPAKSKKP